ncbi:MAG TPA: SDR family oxidoreductase [Polyangiaceae bacterium]|nr:SDR family oxidoreductase [Polyangiaceae bacterium]
MTRAAPSPSARKHPRQAGPEPPFVPQEQSAPGIEALMNPEPDYGADSYRGHARLRGRVALITGGDSGIGRAVALAFAREGADIAFSYLPEEQTDAEKSKEAVRKSGADCVMFALDLADPANCATLVEKTVQHFGRLDILVNNAAHQGRSVRDIAELDPARIEQTLRVNLLAPFMLVRAALPHLRAGSSILNVASIQAYDPSPAILDYATTKGGVVTFTKGLAQSLIERGIRVNCVAPGPVWTPLIVQSFQAEKITHFGENSPMGRPAQPAELAPAFVFLASDEARYVNGEILGVTGGRLLG